MDKKKAVDKIICGNLWIKRLWIKNPQGCRTTLADCEKRYLAESNCSTRFCRPLPNRSAKVPLLDCECKGMNFISFHQIFLSLLFENLPKRLFFPSKFIVCQFETQFLYCISTVLTCCSRSQKLCLSFPAVALSAEVHQPKGSWHNNQCNRSLACVTPPAISYNLYI